MSRRRWWPAPAAVTALSLALVGAGGDRLAAQEPLRLAQAADTDRLAGAIAQIDQLQEELRQLRGRIEELEHGRAADEQRIDALEAQLQGRPQAEGPAPGAGAEPVPAQLSSSAGGTVAPIARGASPSPDPAASTGNVLGTIPRSALLNLPSPDRQDTGAAPAAAPEPANASARQRYDAAMRLLQSANWDAAQQGFQGFLADYPKDVLAPNAAYWLGETYYVRKDYPNAAATFARNYRTYGPDAPKAADELLKLGMSLAALGDTQKACETYGELQKRHPDAGIAIRQALVRERAAAGC